MGKPGTTPLAIREDADPSAARTPRAEQGDEVVAEKSDTGSEAAPDGRPAQSTRTAPAQPAQWLLGGRYRVLDRLGAGGMAEVFRACDELLDRDIAVKVFRSPIDEPGNATSAQRRAVELRALAQLNHPNLIALYDGSLADGATGYLVMELVAGPNLAARLRTGAVGEPEARVIGAQVADALAYVHARGMVHRDVKPANILLGTDGGAEEFGVRARLSDFGIVRMLDDARLTAAAFTLGTASYLAPEQARGGDVGAAADVYALGLVLLEALTGERSFDGPVHEVLAARVSQAPLIPTTLPEPWPGLLAAMTATDPGARPAAEQVARSLRHSRPVTMPAPITPAAAFAAVPVGAGMALAGAGTPADALTPGPPADGGYAGPAPRRTPYGLLAGALLLLAVLGIGAFLLVGQTGTAQPGTGSGTKPSPAAPPTKQAAPPTKQAEKQTSTGRTAPEVVAKSRSRSAARSRASKSAAAKSASAAASSPAGPPQPVLPAPPQSRPAPPPASTPAPSTAPAPSPSVSVGSAAPSSTAADATTPAAAASGAP